VNLDIKPQKPTEKIKNMLAKLNDLPAEAEKEQKTIQELQAENSRMKKELAAKTKPAADEVWVRELKQEIVDRTRIIGQKDDIISQLSKKIEGAVKFLSKEVDTLSPSLQKYEQQKRVDIPPKASTHAPVPVRNVNTSSSGSTAGVGEIKILTACAQYPDGLRRDQLTVITGYKRSSRDTYIQRLKQSGLLTQVGDRLYPTSQGKETLGPNFSPLPTGKQLQHHWLSTLPQGEKAILQALINAYPKAVTRDELSEKTGYLRSSRDTYLQRMSSKEVIVIVGRGEVKASETLFD
jgi:hypothetical protein